MDVGGDCMGVGMAHVNMGKGKWDVEMNSELARG